MIDLIGTLFPKMKARYLLNRRYLSEAQRLYDAVQPSQYRPTISQRTSADGVMNVTGSRLRELSRHLEENHDLVVAVFDDLVNNTIGEGVKVTPMVRTKGGELAEDINDRLLELWTEWGHYPETTGEMSFPSVERMVARSMFRDGEIFVQTVMDSRYPHPTAIKLSLELLEADFVPFDYEDSSRNILHGIQNDQWNRPVGYYTWKTHPGDPLGRGFTIDPQDLKRIDRDQMLHVKFSRRLRQRRGVPITHAVINRLRDLKDYEESERIAAKVAADLTGFIKRSAEYQGEISVNAGGSRDFSLQAGAIFQLQPGEDVGTIQSDRPNTGLEKFRNGMLRAVAGGTGTRYSAISRDYNGTYSAQRQELVEGAIAYRAQFAYIVSRFHRPVYERFIQWAQLSNQLKGRMQVDPLTWGQVDFRAPALPWIDPDSEAKAYATLIESGIESRAEIMRNRGRDPAKVWAELKEEQASGLFESDISKAAAPAPPKQSDDAQKSDETDAAAAA